MYVKIDALTQLTWGLTPLCLFVDTESPSASTQLTGRISLRVDSVSSRRTEPVHAYITISGAFKGTKFDFYLRYEIRVRIRGSGG
jgi:hypothetical protein